MNKYTKRFIAAAIVVVVTLFVGTFLETFYEPLGAIIGFGGGFLAMSCIMGKFPWQVK